MVAQCERSCCGPAAYSRASIRRAESMPCDSGVACCHSAPGNIDARALTIATEASISRGMCALNLVASRPPRHAHSAVHAPSRSLETRWGRVGLPRTRAHTRAQLHTPQLSTLRAHCCTAGHATSDGSCATFGSFAAVAAAAHSPCWPVASTVPLRPWTRPYYRTG